MINSRLGTAKTETVPLPVGPPRIPDKRRFYFCGYDNHRLDELPKQYREKADKMVIDEQFGVPGIRGFLAIRRVK